MMSLKNILLHYGITKILLIEYLINIKHYLCTVYIKDFIIKITIPILVLILVIMIIVISYNL